MDLRGGAKVSGFEGKFVAARARFGLDEPIRRGVVGRELTVEQLKLAVSAGSAVVLGERSDGSRARAAGGLSEGEKVSANDVGEFDREDGGSVGVGANSGKATSDLEKVGTSGSDGDGLGGGIHVHTSLGDNTGLKAELDGIGLSNEERDSLINEQEKEERERKREKGAQGSFHIKRSQVIPLPFGRHHSTGNKSNERKKTREREGKSQTREKGEVLDQTQRRLRGS